MSAYERFPGDPAVAVDLYTRACSINVSAHDLGVMGATLAFGGRNPVTGKQVMDAQHIPGLLAIMATAGMYDDSGKWLFHTGLPTKSGVGGGLVGVAPGKFGIGTFAPPLDGAGNSIRGQRAITDIEPVRAVRLISRRAGFALVAALAHRFSSSPLETHCTARRHRFQRGYGRPFSRTES